MSWISTFLQDARFGLRMLRKERQFAAVAVSTVALGISSATAIFSVVHAVLLNPFPYPESHRLVSVFLDDAHNRGAGDRNYFMVLEFLDFQERSRSFEYVFGVHPQDVLMKGLGEPARFSAGEVTVNTFSALGVAPLGEGRRQRMTSGPMRLRLPSSVIQSS
jgi:hypothetical protein